MQALLESIGSAFSTDTVFAGFAAGWMAIIVWGFYVTVLAYCSRMQERAAMVSPPRHPLFPRRWPRR